MIERNDWNKFILDRAPKSGAFLQMWEWGEFQEATGKTVKRIFTEESAAQMIQMSLVLGKKYWYCPRGPITFSRQDVPLTKGDYRGLPLESALFLRLEPPTETTTPLSPPFERGEDHVRRVGGIQPADTLITDLSPKADDLLKGMHSKTRYNIRLAKKKGVEIEINPTDVSFEDIWPIFETTGSRGAFVLHSKDYYKKMLEALSTDDCRAYLAIARHKKDILAANIMIDCAGTRTYLHGASSNEKRNLMAPYLLHWALIEDAKEKGIDSYDWWGIAPEGVENHKWAGVTRFKLGFGGERLSYAGAFDVILNKSWYWGYWGAKKVLKALKN